MLVPVQKISAAGEMSYFSLLHLYGTNDREREDVIQSGSEESAAVMREEKQGLYKFITAILLINLSIQDLYCLSKLLFYFGKILLCFFPDEWHLLYYLSFHNIQDNKRDIF